ncbi:MAG: cupin domain-containing protein [Actinomycetota bacterium]|nr:cupin domain-containing protein [Actinomycetota bacterium]
MPASTLVSDPAVAREGVPEWSSHPTTGGGGRPRSGPAVPVVVMLSGLALVASAALVLGHHGARHDATSVARPDPSAITVSSRDVSVVTQVYEPGQNSGWHAHPGIHAVAVLSGVLTVYDSQCQAQTFEPGRPYVGGQAPHLVRNEGDAPVTMIVTYLQPSAPTGSTEHMAAPPGCPVA